MTIPPQVLLALSFLQQQRAPTPCELAADDPRVAPGTKRMAVLLEECARSADPATCFALSAERVPLFRERVEAATGKPREPELRLKLAIELMQAGDPEGALAELDRAAVAAKSPASETTEGFQLELDRTRVLCWMRIGEIDNCLGEHCCKSCIAPIDPSAVHANRRGSETAIPLLEKTLARDPEDGEARWLLNLAHMTLGSWPGGVKEEWRIGPERFASEHEMPRFPDVAAECGLDLSTISGGVVTEDFDRDGFLDVMVTSIGLRDPMRFFRSNGDGTFGDRTAEAGLTGLVGGLNMVQGDYDNDGWTDVLVLRGAWFDVNGQIPDSLLRNRGDGTFEDVTEQAGMVSFHPSQTGAFADFDGDGWLDVIIGNESQRREGNHPCELYLNQRDGTFREVGIEVGAAPAGFVKAVAVGDYDNDGRPDVYYSVRAKNNWLKRNVPDPTPGSPGFKLVEVAGNAGVSKPHMSFPAWWFDYDNDGWLDLFVAVNHGFTQNNTDGIGDFLCGKPVAFEMPHLYRNRGTGRFAEVGEKAGVARAMLVMGSNYGDFDNDGWLDMYLGDGAPSFAALVPNKAFRNDRGQRFQDVTTAMGVGHLQKGHGVAFADLDNDGDQDLFHELGGFYTADVYPNCLFENPGTPGNRWLTLQLQGVKANRSAIGARIRVDVATPGGDRSIHLVCGSGGSFGASSLQQEIGLGDATEVRAIFIRWPGSDTKQTLTGAKLDRVYRVVEGRDALEEVAVKRIKLGGAR